MASRRSTKRRDDDFITGQLERRGIGDRLVLGAMRAVPRHLFVPEKLKADAYADRPLPIGAEQTISQPYIVAYMIEALGLQGGERVLEVGAGSGYAAAVLSRIASEVFAVERIGSLALTAARNLERAGIRNVRLRHADGNGGWPEEAPFDAILVSAGAARVPEALCQQLVRGGRMVVPVGEADRDQDLMLVERLGGLRYETRRLAAVRFVPLIGA